MRENRLRAELAAGRQVANAWLSSSATYSAEALSHAGFDAVTVDLQHGMFDVETAIGLLQALNAGPATPLARPTHNDPAQIGKLLDAGAHGIICPVVDTVADCERFVAACRYPPIGARSFGPSRGLLYGGPDYPATADREVMTWAMIESRAAVANLDGILAVEGLDAVFVGPNDLAYTYDIPAAAGHFDDQLVPVLDEILDGAKAAGRPAGIFCLGYEQVQFAVERGWSLITPGNDIGMLQAEAARRLAWVRGANDPQ
jgi:4-hydroxy-2-oxoheptanedioate aldolase